MTETDVYDRRQVTAERNIEAILDAAEQLLRDGNQPTLSAVAAQARVSRPTVYAHFGDRRQLVEAVVSRTVQSAMERIEAAEPDQGSAVDALRRLVQTGWEELARHQAIARAAAPELSPEALQRVHHEAQRVLERLIKRGRREGVFRRDLPAHWLGATCLAVMHAATMSVASGAMDAHAARSAATTTVVDLCAVATRSHAD